MKLLIKLLILAFVVVIAWQYIRSENKTTPLISIDTKDGHYYAIVRGEEKEKIKSVMTRIKNLVYHEATVNNPSGDVVPDQIDDKVIQEIKEKVN